MCLSNCHRTRGNAVNHVRPTITAVTVPVTMEEMVHMQLDVIADVGSSAGLLVERLAPRKRRQLRC